MLRMRIIGLTTCFLLLLTIAVSGGEQWLQLKYDCRHSGNVPDRTVTTPLGLVGAVALTDAVFTSPVVAGQRVYVLDGSGVLFAIDRETLQVDWKFASRGGPGNCNNVSSPAIAGDYIHFGTTAGSYYVLNRIDGSLVKEIVCGEPVFSAPVVSQGRVYFATLGSQVYALQPNGDVCWTWDFVKEVMRFSGDRWSGEDWLKHKAGRVTWEDRFCCSRDIAAYGKMVVVPAGAKTVWLEDTGPNAALRATWKIPSFAGVLDPAMYGQSIGEDGAVYSQWHRRDNAGRVEIMRLKDGEVHYDSVPGTVTQLGKPGLLSFCSVSIRGQDVYRCRPQMGAGFLRHSPDREEPQYLGGYPSIASPILLKDRAVYGGLDGRLYVVPLSEGEDVWSFETPFDAPISAPAAACDGQIYFGCEDGYLYVLGPEGKAAPPTKDLEVWKVRSPLRGELAGPAYDWYTNHGDLANTNANNQGVKPPFAVKWVRRYEGTFKHLPVCGGGRMYTHTAEGQIFAVEQDTGRLLWRRYYPHVYLSFTAPLYHKERLLLPQAGWKQSRLRCLDAKTGKLFWEAPFTGTPSWNRQMPPVVYNNVAIYMFGSGKFAPSGNSSTLAGRGKVDPSPPEEEVSDWIYFHDNPRYARDNKPLVRAWDVQTGKELWSRDFSHLGAGGNDSGLCLMGDTVYYSTFFGYAAQRRGKAGNKGLTAALDPMTGEVRWLTTEYYVTAGCAMSGKDGRLYLGGTNPPNDTTKNRYICCLDARDGSLIWQSEPIKWSFNAILVTDDFIFNNASKNDAYVFDKETGKITDRFNYDWYCTRLVISEPYVFGPNMDVVDLSDGNKLVSTGPAVDNRECVAPVVSNGRIFYTSQAAGVQMSQVCGSEAASFSPWRQPARKGN